MKRIFAFAPIAALLAGCLESSGPTAAAGVSEQELSVAAATTTTYEAEKATLHGAVVANAKTGFTGTGYADYINPTGDYVEWSVSVPSSGSYTLTFRFANGGTTSRGLKITKDGSQVNAKLAFMPTGAWTTWKTVSITNVSLSSGSHKIRAAAVDQSGPNMDNLAVTSGSTTPPPPPPSGAPTPSQLLALTSSCNKIGGSYATDDGGSSNVNICKLNGAVYWKADMDIDCDGVSTSTCNSNTDPWYQNQTSFTTSSGGWLNSATLPYYVVPLPSSRFDYTKNGIHAGQVAAVIFNGKMVYAVFGDEGPSNIIGEASVATANALGIYSNPKDGGSDGPVTYIVFTGSSGVVSPIEDHGKATSLGQSLATTLLKNN